MATELNKKIKQYKTLGVIEIAGYPSIASLAISNGSSFESIRTGIFTSFTFSASL